MDLRRTLVALPQLLAALLVFAPAAEARTVDRVAAIAGSRVILLSEVRHAATPAIRKIHETDPLARARAETKALRAACEELIDDRLVDEEAERMHVVVTDDEIDRAIDAVATNNGRSRAELLVLATEQGFSEHEYRDVLRAQLLRAKVTQLRKPKMKPFEEAEAALVAELRAKVYVEDRLAP